MPLRKDNLKIILFQLVILPLQQNFSKDPLVTIGDLSRIFDNKPSDNDYFGDHVHYSNAGRAVIVKHMMHMLRNPVLIQAQQ